MKNLKKFIPLLVLALLVLAACTNPLAKEAPAKVVDLPVTTRSASVEETTDITCNQLRGSDAREDCKVQVNEIIGAMLNSEIVDSFDAKRCKELPSGVAENCEDSIAESGVQGPVSDEDLVIFNEAMRGSFPDTSGENGEGETPFLFPVYDITMCSQLKTPGYKAHCENLLADKIERSKMEEIIESDDSKRCDELENEDYKIECESFFGIGEALGPIEKLLESISAEVPPGADVVQ